MQLSLQRATLHNTLAQFTNKPVVVGAHNKIVDSLRLSDRCCPQLAPVLQVAFIGFVVQALVTRSNGPVDDLTNHISNPFGSNIITNVARLPETLTRH